MDGILQGPGEGEKLFGGRIVLRSSLPALTITETWYDRAQPGASPHFHHEHVDSFYVLEGELAFLVHDQEHVLGPGGFVSAPPGVVHGFRSLSPARFLNFHTPDGRFAENLRARNRGEEGGFDSVEADPGSGLTAGDAILLRAGEGEALETEHRIATIKASWDELALVEFELRPSFGGPDPHSHEDHTDAFYVLDGEVGFLVGDDEVVAGPGTFAAAPPGVTHTFTSSSGGGRLLNIHAPGVGFADRLREWSRSTPAA